MDSHLRYNASESCGVPTQVFISARLCLILAALLEQFTAADIQPGWGSNMTHQEKISAKDAPDLSRFDWEDPFFLERQLSEDERMLRDAAKVFAQETLAPKVRKAYAEEIVDPTVFAEMGAAGLLGVTIPEDLGGLGAGYVTYGLVAREIERVDSGYRSMMSVQSSLVM